jgi:glycerol uptake facilitator protein
MSPFLAEYLGTLLLILLGDGVVAAVLLKKSKAENAGWFVICSGWALAVTFGIYLAGKYSGAHLNPAVTLSLAVIGKFEWVKVPSYLLAQLLGAFSGAVLVWLHYLPHWKLTEDPEAKLAVFCTGPAIRNTFSNLFSEFLATFIFIFGVLIIGENKYAEGLNPIVLGLLIVSIGHSLGGTTGWAINPVRDFGPRLAHFLLPIAGKGSSDWAYSWIPVVGPLLGGMAAALLHQALF